jgi:phospholipid/cholesterol/gamma-HCH transport system ATP-binding protein
VQTHRRHGVTSVIVTHDMKTAHKVADRIIMLYPLSRLAAGEKQVVFDGTSADLAACADPRVTQFVRGEAGDRLLELAGTNGVDLARGGDGDE